MIAVGRYVDDYFWAEPEEAAEAARESFIQMAAALSFPIDLEKTPLASSTLDILGIEVSFLHDRGEWPAMWLRPDLRKVQFWRQTVLGALQSNVLPFHDAQKLAGRLSFGVAAVWGEVARSRLHTLFAHIAAGRNRLRHELAADLQWWQSFLEHPLQRPRPLCPASIPCVILYTDAEGSGGLGAVLLESAACARWIASSTPSPVVARLQPRRTQIHAHEILAVFLAAQSFRKFITDKRLVIFVDNKSALGMLVKGAGMAPDLEALAILTCQILLSSSADLRWVWVPSRFNLADAPSRGKAPIVGQRIPSSCQWSEAERVLAVLQSQKRVPFVWPLLSLSSALWLGCFY
jgi:hypothetical protein